MSSQNSPSHFYLPSTTAIDERLSAIEGLHIGKHFDNNCFGDDSRLNGMTQNDNNTQSHNTQSHNAQKHTQCTEDDLSKLLIELSGHLPSIYLVGPMGAGKTTIGKMLAKQLNRQFFDCDWYISEQTGADIAWIFEKEGESGFRKRESDALAQLTALPNVVLATGGGAVGQQINRQYLKNGLVIYLKADVETQLLRTQKDKNRPLLQQDDPKAVLERLYQIRHPLYSEVADIVVPTGRLYPRQMVNAIMEQLVCFYDNTQL